MKWKRKKNERKEIIADNGRTVSTSGGWDGYPTSFT